jgi:hypothetical protein
MSDSNGLTTAKGQLPAAVANLAGGLAQSAQSATSMDGLQYMKFTKFGEFLFGADSIEVEADSQWAINPNGFGQGWIAWGDKAHGTEGEMLGEVMGPAAEPMPAMPAPVEGTWTEQRAMQLACVSGEDEGTQCLFKANSLGGKKLYASIVTEVVKRINAGESAIVPVVTLGADSYQHQKYGKIFTPEYAIVRWEEMDATPESAAEAAAAEEPAEEEAPRRRRRKA